jgi:CrcB protein
MHSLFLIAAGGAAGAMTRFMVADCLYSHFGRAFPHATLFINVSGSFLMGFLTPLVLRLPLAMEWRAALLVGFLGAYTTFSSFSIETIILLESGELSKAMLNIALNVVLCLLACWLGLLVARPLFNDGLAWGIQLPATLHFSLLVWLSVFLLAMGYEWLASNVSLTLWSRFGIAVLVLSGASALSTGLMTQPLSAEAPSLGALSGLFMLNTLLCAALLMAGSATGQWLWSLKTST